jgi:hypothetical protein
VRLLTNPEKKNKRLDVSGTSLLKHDKQKNWIISNYNDAADSKNRKNIFLQ